MGAFEQMMQIKTPPDAEAISSLELSGEQVELFVRPRGTSKHFCVFRLDPAGAWYYHRTEKTAPAEGAANG